MRARKDTSARKKSTSPGKKNDQCRHTQKAHGQAKKGISTSKRHEGGQEMAQGHPRKGTRARKKGNKVTQEKVQGHARKGTRARNNGKTAPVQARKGIRARIKGTRARNKKQKGIQEKALKTPR